MKDSEISNLIYNHYKNYKNISNYISNYNCNCFIKNRFFKAKSNYDHVKFIKEIRRKTLENYNQALNSNKYVKRIVYKETNNSLEFAFAFGKIINENVNLYLHKTKAFSMNDIKENDLAEKIKKIKIKKFNKLSSITLLDDFEKTKSNIIIKVKLKKNSQKENSHIIFHIVLEEKNNNSRSSTYISIPFSSICFKQFSKRKEKSFLGIKFRNKESDLPYYLNGMFKKNSWKEFKSIFNFKINFYEYKEENENDYSSSCTDYLNNINNNNNNNKINNKYNNSNDVVALPEFKENIPQNYYQELISHNINQKNIENNVLLNFLNSNNLLNNGNNFHSENNVPFIDDSLISINNDTNIAINEFNNNNNNYNYNNNNYYNNKNINNNYIKNNYINSNLYHCNNLNNYNNFHINNSLYAYSNNNINKDNEYINRLHRMFDEFRINDSNQKSEFLEKLLHEINKNYNEIFLLLLYYYNNNINKK